MRRILISIHLSLGVTAGLLLVVIALTGALYAFEPQLRALWGERVERSAEQALLSPVELLARLEAQGLEGAAQSFLWPEERTLPLAVRWEFPEGTSSSLLLDPHTGQRLPRAERAQRFFLFVLNLHRTLAAGETGKAIVGWSSVSLLLLTFSGLGIAVRRWSQAGRIWWPKRAERASRAPQVRWRLWHRLAGAWLTPWLLLMPLTGMVWAFDGYAAALRSMGGPSRLAAVPALPEETPVAVDWGVLWERALEYRTGDRHMRLIAPAAPGAPARFEWTPPEAASMAMRSRLYLHPSSGEVLAHQPWEAFTAGEQLVRWAYPVHTGRIAGPTGQAVAFVASLSLPFFFGSGLYLWLRRRRVARAPATLSKPTPIEH